MPPDRCWWRHENTLGTSPLRPTQRILPDVFHHADFKTNHGLKAELIAKRARTATRLMNARPVTKWRRASACTRVIIFGSAQLRRATANQLLSCHQPTTFCRMYSGQDSAHLAWAVCRSGRQFHPPGFTDLPGTARGAQHHAFATQKI